METRRLIAAMFASMAVFMLWMAISVKIWPPPPPEERERDRPVERLTAEDEPSTTTAPADAPTARPAMEDPATRPAVALENGYRVVGGEDLTSVHLGNAEDDSPYPMALEITPRGAGVLGAELRGYKQSVQEQIPYRLLGPLEMSRGPGFPDRSASFVTPRVRFHELDLGVDLENVTWALDPASDAERKIFFVDIVRADDVPVARVVKTYTLREQPLTRKIEERTYDLDLSVTIENLSDQPFTATLAQRGPLGVKREDRRMPDRRVIGAVYRGRQVEYRRYLRKDVFEKREILGRDDERDEEWFAWAAVANTYFAAIMAPAGRVGPDDELLIRRVETAHLTDVKELPDRINKIPGEDLTFEIITEPMAVLPGETREVAFDCYIGPKSKLTFEAVPVYDQREYFATIAAYFYFCAPAGLSRIMMMLLEALHRVPPHNYGVAIIILVLMVRLILHPITKKSQLNLMKMQKQMSSMQPKIQAIKEKYANDRQAMNQAMMEAYREAGINPAGNLLTCLPLFLQLPIWAALWAALNSTVEMRHAPFDGWWIKDLAGVDALISFDRTYVIPLVYLITGPIFSFNLLPILLAVSQILQAKYMPRGNPAVKQATGAPDQLEQQRKMMMFMSLFFMLILYNAPAGLNLYIMCSNIFGILEQLRIRKHLADMDAKQAALAATAEAAAANEPAAAAKARDAKPRPAQEPKKESWLQRKWRELEKQAEEAKRVQGRSKKKKSQTRR